MPESRPIPLVRLLDVHKAFGSTKVLQGITMDVERESTAVVMGGSGSGKSVLIKHIVKLLRPDRGEVWAFGERMDQLSGNALDAARLKTGYLFQSGALFDSMTVAENFDFVLDRHTKLGPAERRDRIAELLEWVGLAKTMEQFPSELSGGQKKRIALARAIALNPVLMLFDEPTTGLDPISVRMVSNLIVRLREERGMTSVVITHDMLCVEIVGGTVHYLDRGVILESGSLDEIRRSQQPAISNFFGNDR